MDLILGLEDPFNESREEGSLIIGVLTQHASGVMHWILGPDNPFNDSHDECINNRGPDSTCFMLHELRILILGLQDPSMTPTKSAYK